ncbi:hypothetical protein B0T11DRAFT_329062 [Plectosphaerella cucumerina]|jgi:hypothetical protein|uniref:Rhomboid family membrane protein n=1 Tax=Plectosphaerella cucumerina TaxID=40658 RepID=A0A8K0TID0_9PEZI|nr:hypothetical protein B0T11DRAFT_329062 [Plectosphaerella cucumerina]
MAAQPAGTGAPEQPQTPTLLHNAAIAGAIICPIIMLLPPRRLDWRFAILGGTFSMATSQLAYDYTGRSIHQRIGDRVQGAFSNELPEAAKETQRRLREERMRKLGLSEEEMRRQEQAKRGVAARLWYGAEDKDEWQKKRHDEHQKALEEGKGLSDIIIEQVKEVLPGGGKKDDDEKKP